MLTRATFAALALVTLAASASADVSDPAAISRIAGCQKKIASAGARFAQQVIRDTLKCTNEVAKCQVQCELGAFGPSCDNSPPPCCDSDDPDSTQGFHDCMVGADETCSEMDTKIVQQEAVKQSKITAGCSAERVWSSG